jgi:hypothetical protein
MGSHGSIKYLASSPAHDEFGYALEIMIVFIHPAGIQLSILKRLLSFAFDLTSVIRRRFTFHTLLDVSED